MENGCSCSRRDFVRTSAMNDRSTMADVSQRIIDGELVPEAS